MKIGAVARQVKIRPAIKGLLTCLPGMQRILSEKGTGGTNTALYCYGVWLKHLTLLWENGMHSIPHTLAELGPGDSMGIGLAAMLSGVDNYYALDVVRHTNIDTNVRILDELVDLFDSRASRPTKGWPNFDESLDENLFPSHILSDEVLSNSLSEERVSAIRDALMNKYNENHTVSIKYMVPWSDASIIAKDSVDVVLSHSVLEHVVDIESTYNALYSWLKPGGLMTHQIDFRSHGLSTAWNGFRAYPELLWKIITGRRSFLINRQPYSTHIDVIFESGFKFVCNLANHRTDGIQRLDLSARWEDITDNDLTCSGAFIQAVK